MAWKGKKKGKRCEKRREGEKVSLNFNNTRYEAITINETTKIITHNPRWRRNLREQDEATRTEQQKVCLSAERRKKSRDYTTHSAAAGNKTLGIRHKKVKQSGK